MKTFTLILALSLAPLGVLSADCPAHQLAEAQAQAAKDQKSVLLVFVGGDWSEPSKKFREEILENEEMTKKLSENFIIHTLEFPEDGAKADKTHKELREKYRVSRLPTLLLTDELGRPFGYSGYRSGAAEGMMKALDQGRELRGKRDAAFNKAAGAKGVKRAKAMVEGLNLLPRHILREHYHAELDAIKKADPKGESKLIPELEKEEELTKERNQYNALFREKKFEEVIKLSQEASSKAIGEDAQRLAMYGIQALVSQKKYDEANKAIEAMSKLAPETQFGKSVARYKKVVAGIKERNENPKPKPSAKPAKPRGPIVSKPVAVVSDIKVLEDDLIKLKDEIQNAAKKSAQATAVESHSSKRISELENELNTLRESQKKNVETAKNARDEQLRLTKKAKLLAEVIENHQAMEKRKKDGELQKKGEGVRD